MKYLEQLAKDVDELLKCPICLDQIKQPKSLPCQHSFCLDPCLENMKKRESANLYTIECPLCRKKARFPNVQAIKKLPDNLYLKNLLESRKNAQKQMEKESPLYMTIRIVTEDQFHGHQGNDLYDPTEITYQEFRVRKHDSLRDVINLLSEKFGKNPEQLRLWPVIHRSYQALRPTFIDYDFDILKHVFEVADRCDPFTIFLEITSPWFVQTSLPPFDKLKDVLLFFKYYDPAEEKIIYMGHMYIKITAKLSSVIPTLISRAKLPFGTILDFYEEIRPNFLEKIEDLEKTLEDDLEELMDGDIIVFEKATNEGIYRLPSCKNYFLMQHGKFVLPCSCSMSPKKENNA